MEKMDIEFVRNHFPALKNDFIFMDNAGGSQVLSFVLNNIGEFLTHYNVQLGASYKVSAAAQEKLDSVLSEIAEFVNAKLPQEIIIGSSSTMLLRILSMCISKQWQAGDEVIVTNSDHEANVSCWTDLKASGIKIKTWKVNPNTLEFDIKDLQDLLSNKTKLVAMVHASNILGTINPLKNIAKTVHQAGALFCVDGVAYAPHRLIDVQDFDVDFYVFSTYKTYGPHQAIMYGRYDLLREMDGINHYFISKDEVPYKFQPGNYNYELTYSLQGISSYFIHMYNHHFPNRNNVDKRTKYENSFNLIALHEEKLSLHLLQYLTTIKDVTIIGANEAGREKRVPTLSFIHEKYQSSDVVKKIDTFNIGIRFGDFYAKKIINDLGLVEKDGVIRVSMVHYNSIAEIDSLINAFNTIF